MQTKRFFNFVGLLLVIAMVLGACTPAATPTQAPAPAQPAQPAQPAAQPTQAPGAACSTGPAGCQQIL